MTSQGDNQRKKDAREGKGKSGDDTVDAQRQLYNDQLTEERLNTHDQRLLTQRPADDKSKLTKSERRSQEHYGWEALRRRSELRGIIPGGGIKNVENAGESERVMGARAEYAWTETRRADALPTWLAGQDSDSRHFKKWSDAESPRTPPNEDLKPEERDRS